MIWKYLQVVGLRDGKTYFELNLVFDNCAGQNKNRMVIRLLFFLVKMKIFKTARAIFLIKGHTKNDCDRMFNLMKQDYRKMNCYTPPELNDLINKHPLCTAIPMLPNDFLDWDALQNKMVDKADGILKNHIFTVKSSDSNNVWIQEYNRAPISKQMLVKNAYLNSDWRKVFKLDVVPPPKLPDIKWNKLYYKWGRFVPEDRKKGPQKRYPEGLEVVSSHHGLIELYLYCIIDVVFILIEFLEALLLCLSCCLVME